MSRASITVTRFWMRTVPFEASGDVIPDQGHDLQAVEVLIEHNGKWITIFGPKGAGICAYVNAQTIDNMIHGGGVRSLVEYGSLYGGNRVGGVRGREVKKPDRRDGTDRRGDKRRTGDKVTARLKARKS